MLLLWYSCLLRHRSPTDSQRTQWWQECCRRDLLSTSCCGLSLPSASSSSSPCSSYSSLSSPGQHFYPREVFARIFFDRSLFTDYPYLESAALSNIFWCAVVHRMCSSNLALRSSKEKCISRTQAKIAVIKQFNVSDYLIPSLHNIM